MKKSIEIRGMNVFCYMIAVKIASTIKGLLNCGEVHDIFFFGGGSFYLEWNIPSLNNTSRRQYSEGHKKTSNNKVNFLIIRLAFLSVGLKKTLLRMYFLNF